MEQNKRKEWDEQAEFTDVETSIMRAPMAKATSIKGEALFTGILDIIRLDLRNYAYRLRITCAIPAWKVGRLHDVLSEIDV